MLAARRALANLDQRAHPQCWVDICIIGQVNGQRRVLTDLIPALTAMNDLLLLAIVVGFLGTFVGHDCCVTEDTSRIARRDRFEG